MLTKQQMLAALDGLIDEAGKLHAIFVKELLPWSPRFVVWLKADESTVETIFGSVSDAFLSFKSTHFVPTPSQQFTNDIEKRNAELTWFDSGLRYATTTLIGYRYSVERLAVETPARSTPYIFISHGGPTLMHVIAVKEFLQALGLAPIVVRDMPNLNLSVNEKVRVYMGICTAAIALATVEDETTAREQRARPNVENEIGMLQSAPNIASRIIYLKEPSVKFASNYQEKVWIPFKNERVQDAFIPLAKEIKAFGLLG
ncbi:MAG: hypothetical protein DME26_23180 [Verrucomicrobia bacterium]|nr:MAG: hypothetical protein DME26_23180 [Verrucomicrobiota bacterium]